MLDNSIPRIPLDYRKPAEQLVLEIINIENGIELTTKDISIDKPISTPTALRNTKVALIAKPGSKLKGTVLISYNRVAMSHIAKDKSTEFPITNETKISDLIPAIDSRYNTRLQPVDYIDGPLPNINALSNNSGSIDLVAGPDSLVFIDKLSLSIHRTGIMLNQVLSNFMLNGLTYSKPVNDCGLTC